MFERRIWPQEIYTIWIFRLSKKALFLWSRYWFGGASGFMIIRGARITAKLYRRSQWQLLAREILHFTAVNLVKTAHENFISLAPRIIMLRQPLFVEFYDYDLLTHRSLLINHKVTRICFIPSHTFCFELSFSESFWFYGGKFRNVARSGPISYFWEFTSLIK